MKTRYLFPHSCKKWGWILFFIGLSLGVFARINNFETDQYLVTKVWALINDSLLSKTYFQWIENGLLDEIIIALIGIGGILIGFSKIKEEDEYSFQLRTESLIWSFYINFALLLISTFLIYGIAYFEIMIYQLFSMLHILYSTAFTMYCILLINQSNMKNSLKVQRAIKNITQADLAEAIGVSRQTINAMEKGKYVPSTVLALKLAQYFNQPVEAIFQLNDND